MNASILFDLVMCTSHKDNRSIYEVISSSALSCLEDIVFQPSFPSVFPYLSSPSSEMCISPLVKDVLFTRWHYCTTYSFSIASLCEFIVAKIKKIMHTFGCCFDRPHYLKIWV